MALSRLSRALEWNIYRGNFMTGTTLVAQKLNVKIKHIVLVSVSSPGFMIYIINEGRIVRIIYGHEDTFSGFETSREEFIEKLTDPDLNRGAVGLVSTRIRRMVARRSKYGFTVKSLTRKKAKQFLGWDFDT